MPCISGCLSCASYTVYPILASMGLCLETETEELLIKVTAVLYIGSGINIYISFYIIWFFIIRFDLCTKRLQR